MIKYMYNYFERVKEKKIIKERIKQNIQLEKKLKEQIKLKIAFFVLSDSLWKLDNLYREMLKDTYFEPIIIICPWVNLGKEKMEYEMNKTEKFFKEKKFNYIKTIKKNGEYLDVEREVKPDIVFYTTPYRGLIDDRYYITNIKKSLCCYVPYYFDPYTLYELGYDLLFHNLLWKFFIPTKEHLKYSKQYSRNKGKNVEVVRYGILEEFYKFNIKSLPPKSSYKIIIWAPHHTISSSELKLEWSTFEKYYKFMLEISEKYKDRIKIIFKPHPLLYSRLVELWGKEKTVEYFNKWSEVSYRGIELGNYIELFYKSDAMIHDCASFTSEYLFFNKPVCKLVNKIDYSKTVNSIGREALKCHTLAYSESDILKFIDDILISKDEKKEERNIFYKEYLEITPDNLPSKEIIKIIKNKLKV